MKRALLAALLMMPALASAHGGLPVSQRVLRSGETMYIPVAFWGLWVGDGVGPWTWICEEVINPNRARKFALAADGKTFYTNDLQGVTVSNDNGCTWTDAPGELATLRTTDVAADADDAATAYVTTDQVDSDADGGTVADNAVFVTHDHGVSFARLGTLDGAGLRFQSVKSAPGGVLYVTSSKPSSPFEVTLYRSIDGGQSFAAHPLTFSISGALAYSAEVMAIDPRNHDVVWLRAFLTVPGDGGSSMPLQVLLRSSDGGTSFVEVTRTVGETTPSGATRGLDGVAVDPKRARVFVATSHGLLAGDDDGTGGAVTLAPTSMLTQAQCVDVHGDSLYVCSSNYAPDFAALARSDDGGKTFVQVLSYQATQGPVSCPAGTPVGDQCPLYWSMYSAQLGINQGLPDGGMHDGGSGGGGGGCSCSFGGSARLPAFAWLVLLVAGLVLGRRYLQDKGGAG